MIRLAPALLLLAACDGFPRDAEGTLDRIKAGKQFTVAFEPTGQAADDTARALVERLARETDATPRIVDRSGEPLLLEIEDGKVDLALIPLDEKSPWAHRVTIGPELSGGNEPAHLVPVTRNGENAWADLVHRAAETP